MRGVRSVSTTAIFGIFFAIWCFNVAPVWYIEEATDLICTATTPPSAVRLVCLPTLPSGSKTVVALHFNITSGLSWSYAPAAAFSSNGSTSVPEYTGMAALPAVSNDRITPLPTSRATIITFNYSIAADASFSPALSFHGFHAI